MVNLRLYRIIFSIFTLISVFVWGVFLFTIDPFDAGAGLFVVFYVDLAIAFVGLATLIGYTMRVVFLRKKATHHRLDAFRVSFRQSILFALLLIGFLLLQASRLLTLGNGILFLAVLTLVEFFFQSKTASVASINDSEISLAQVPGITDRVPTIDMLSASPLSNIDTSDKPKSTDTDSLEKIQ